MTKTTVVVRRFVAFRNRFLLQFFARRTGRRGLELQVLIGGKSGSWSRQVLATRMNQIKPDDTSRDMNRILDESVSHQLAFCGWQILRSPESR